MPTGIVLAVTEKNGGRFKVGNDWYGLSYQAVKAGAAFMPSKGDEVEFSTDAKGYVDRLTSGKGPSAGAATTVAATPATPSPAAGWIPPANVKAQALQAASALMAGSSDGQTVEHFATECLHVAQLFQDWLLGQAAAPTSSPVLRQAAAVVNSRPDLPF